MQRIMGVMLLTLLLVGYTGVSHAGQLTTIYDTGETTPIHRYSRRLSPAQKRSPREDVNMPRSLSALPMVPPLSSPMTFPMAFPITTPTMQPGRVKPTAFRLPHLQTPLFLMGSDDVSTQWLQQRRDELHALGAVGLLVEADSQETFRAIKALAKGLRLIPASATGIAQSLGLQHYPVLITKTGWEQ